MTANRTFAGTVGSVEATTERLDDRGVVHLGQRCGQSQQQEQCRVRCLKLEEAQVSSDGGPVTARNARNGRLAEGSSPSGDEMLKTLPAAAPSLSLLPRTELAA